MDSSNEDEIVEPVVRPLRSGRAREPLQTNAYDTVLIICFLRWNPSMLAVVTIRPAIPVARPHLREAIVELQDYERVLHMTRLPGEAVADAG